MSRTRHHRDRRVDPRSATRSWSPMVDAGRDEHARLDVEAGLRFADDYPRGVVLGLWAAHGQVTKVAHLDDDMDARWERDHLHHRGRRRNWRDRSLEKGRRILERKRRERYSYTISVDWTMTEAAMARLRQRIDAVEASRAAARVVFVDVASSDGEE